MMVAGEASGDLLGGALLSALRERFPRLTAVGVGGARMRACGLQSAFDINDLAVVGLVEVIRHFPRLRQVFLALVRLLEVERPRLLITIDLPDFNLLLARRAKALAIPVVHYVSPQVWAWRRGRVTRIARLLDHLMVLFPFEPPIYQQTTLPVTFVGHPLVHLAVPTGAREAVRHGLGMVPGEKLLLLLPGSRRGELRQLLAPMLATCRLLARLMPQLRFVLALAESLSQADLQACWPDRTSEPGMGLPPVLVRCGETYPLLEAADAALVASGTATLEAALLGTPMVVVYRVNRFTYEIGRRLIQVPFISLANLVAGYGLVTERIQDEVSPPLLAQDLLSLLTGRERVEQMRVGFAAIRAQLSHPERQPVEVISAFLGEPTDGGGSETTATAC
ncbi:MAG: lipid-A-disaccharide synthase [Magnetococcales bacterium]|nr:lipid-A-disaccharide synthase [Magnetococcales bacterium]